MIQIRKRRVAVLTGDVVKSSAMAPRKLDLLFREMSRAVEVVQDWPDLKAKFERYRGDGWQLVLNQPKLALRVALFLRATLRSNLEGFETRIAVGVGGAGNLKWDALGASEGEAFLLSGHLLDELKNPWLMDLRVSPDIGAHKDLLEAVFGLCDAVAFGWTPRQASVMRLSLMMESSSQHSIAGHLDISQSTVAEHFKKGGGRAITRALEAFEATAAWSEQF